MQVEKVGVVDSVPVLADTAAHTFVGLDGNVPSAGAKVYGVCIADTANGDYAPVAITGILLVLAGAAIAAKAAVTTDASGNAVTAAAVTDTVTTTTTGTATPASGATAVTSSGAQPAIPITATSTSTAVLAGGVLPVSINGYAIDAATEAGQLIRIRLV